ncbi:MAG TPA: hypothetical protein VES20_17325 [Bryobacteraceae bacterium]|nr:hypothetical protein [Bryobacteraceae bacterium]
MAQRTAARARVLTAGRVQALYRDGALRYVRAGDVEVLRHIYVAVRDRNWGTIPLAISNEAFESTDSGFVISFDAEHRQDDILFTWRGTIRGTADRIEFEMDGEAGSSFLKNRIGICVLHGATECAGLACTVTHGDGQQEATQFPELISPHQPFLDVRSISCEPAPGLTSTVSFEGEYFETEDQRNWTDDSFKTYSTPLKIPFPVRVEAGHRVRHRVVLEVIGRELPVITASEDEPRPLPQIGVGWSPGSAHVDDLRLQHLRVDVRPSQEGWEDHLTQAATAARAMNAGLEAAIYASSDLHAEFSALAAHPAAQGISRWIVYDQGRPATSAETIFSARAQLNGHIGGGADANFADLNRNRGGVEQADFICFSANPQVHGVDDLTIVETVGGQAAAVRSAIALGKGKPVAVTPLTFYARGRSSQDARQATPFNAAWTLASLSSIAHAGASSVTLHDLKGLTGSDGAPYPVLNLLRQIADFSPEGFVPTRCSRPREAAALLLSRGAARRLLIANLTPEQATIVLAPHGMRIAVEPYGTRSIDL